jgi:hypothetical protein
MPSYSAHILYQCFYGKAGYMMKRFFIPAVAGLLAGCMLCFPRDAAQAAADACSLWAVAVLPSLFPFLVCMLLITGSLKAKGKNGINRVFGLPSAFIPVMAMVCYPALPAGPGSHRSFH